MNVVLINHLLDVESDVVQHSSGREGDLIEDKTIVSLPNVSQRNDDYMMGGGVRPLTVSNVVEVKREEGKADIINGYRGPKEFKDEGLPHLGLGRAVEKEMVNGVFDSRAHGTQGRHMGSRE